MRKNSRNSEHQNKVDNLVHLLSRAESCLQAKEYHEALEYLDRASRSGPIQSASPETYRFHYLRGLAFFWQGNQRAAWEEVESAFGAFKRVHPSFTLPKPEELPAFAAKNLKALRAIEVALFEGLEGRSSEETAKNRERLERRIFEISASLENLTPLSKLHQLAGSILRHLGKLPEAIEHLEWAATGFRLSRDWASLAETLNRISLVHMAGGELQTAIQILEQARHYSLKAKNHYFELILRSNVALCQLLAGVWRIPLSSLPDVLAESKKAGDFPRYTTTLLLWGQANLLAGRVKECRKALTEAKNICLEKKLLGVLKFSYGFLADLAMAENQLEEAEAHLKKVLEVSETSAPSSGPMGEAWQKLGEVYAARREYDRAMKAFATSQEHLSKHPEKLVEGAVWRGIGVCHLKTEQFRLGQKDFKKAFEVFESCGNEWEQAKTAVLAAECGAFAAAEIYPKLVWAKEIFKKLEHPAWRKRAQAFLEQREERPANVPLRVAHRLAEKEEIVKALAETNGNISQAAKKLGVLRQTLQYKIKQYKIDA